MKRSNSGVYLLFFIYAVLPVFFIGLYLAGNIYSLRSVFEPYNLSIITGSAAFVVFMAQFLLAARVPWLERRIPQDRLLSLHGVIGMQLAGLILIHFILKNILVLRTNGPTPQSALGILAMILFVVLMPMSIGVLKGLRKKSKRAGIPYQRAKKLHNLFALAGVLVVVHVLLAYSSRSWGIQLFVIAWSGLTLGSYIYHKIIRPRRRIPLTLDSIQELGGDLHRYNFSPLPGIPAKKLAHQSGQFAYWSFESQNIGAEEHPFTIASSPSETPAIIVRSSGDYTGLMPRIELGTRVFLDGPYGHFTPEHFPAGTPIIGIAGGIGITPFLSMAGNKDISSRYRLHLLWSIRSAEERAAGKVLFNAEQSGLLYLRTIETSSEGRISREMVSAIIEEALGESATAAKDKAPVVLLCGPAGFTQSIRLFLKQMNFPRRAIYEERFSWK